MSVIPRFLVAAVVSTALAASACTAITFAQWSGYTESPDGGSSSQDGSTAGAQSACNAPYLRGLSACGKCMEDNCSSYISLVCQIDSGAPAYTSNPGLSWPDEYLLPCAEDTNVNNGNCPFLSSPDASLSSSGDPAALESNVNVCLKGSCYDACRTCPVSYSGCSGTNVTVGPDSPCGNCIATQCQTELANCCNDLYVDPIAACSRTSKSCNGSGNCTSVFSLDAGASSTCSYTAYKCIRDRCGPSGMGACQ